MYRLFLVASMVVPHLAFAQDAPTASAGSGLSYTYVELRYLDGDERGSDGLRIGGSYRVNEDWLVLGEIGDLDVGSGADQSTYKIGGGYIHPLEDQNFDLIGTVSLIRKEFSGSFFDADDTGIALSAGARGSVSPRFEVRGSVNHVNLDNNDTYLELAGDYHFTEQLSAGVGIEFAGDEDLLSIGVRFYPH